MNEKRDIENDTHLSKTSKVVAEAAVDRCRAKKIW